MASLHMSPEDLARLAGIDKNYKRKVEEAFFGAGGYANTYDWTPEFQLDPDKTMRELNARIPEKKRKLPTITLHAIETADKRHATIMLLVPNAFGTPEPLLDGATGKPVDFFDDFGDPRRWTRNMGPEIQKAAQVAGKTCAAMVRLRGALT